MKQSVYSNETHGGTPPFMFKIPKNVRQIGQVNELKKIYVEDYVMSFIKKVGTQKDSSSELVVLLGQFVKLDNCQCTFISGAIEIKNVLFEDDLVLTNEVWTEIYDTIKQYFTSVEIVGWSIIKAGLPLSIDERIRKAHSDNFAGQNKILLLYDSLEREEVFFVFEENMLRKQEGYYIFYEKNTEMQNYIISTKQDGTRDKSQTPSMFTANQRNTTTKKHDRKDISTLPSVSNKRPALMYGIGAVAAVVVLVVSAAMLNSYDKMKGMEEAIGVLSENVEQGKQTSNENEVSLPVETAQGKLATINNEVVEEPVVEKEVTSSPQAETNDSTSDSSPSTESTKQAEVEKEEETNKTEKAVESSTKSDTYYTVKEGDTLISIAVKLYNSKSYVKQIKELNNIEDTDKIKVGQKLLIP